jgi:hypothetical protein
VERRLADPSKLIERARQAGLTDAEICAAIEKLIAAKAGARPRKRGRPRLKLWMDPDREHVIRIAALVAQKIALPYEAAGWAAKILRRKTTEPRSIRERLAEKYRRYFPDGLAPDHPLNISIAPGFKFSSGNAFEEDPRLPPPVWSFEELLASAPPVSIQK